MLVLIDESGNAGFKISRGSSPFFTLAMVVFSDFKEAEKVSKTISDLRNKLRVGKEFKFSRAHPKIRDEFFSSICSFDFSVRALVVDKKNVYSPDLRLNAENFYNYCLMLLMKHDDGMLKNASIKIDGSGSKLFKMTLKNYLRQNVSSHKIKKLKFVDSKQDNLIQLADMVVGAIARSNNETRRDSNRWLKILQRAEKIDNIWLFK